VWSQVSAQAEGGLYIEERREAEGEVSLYIYNICLYIEREMGRREAERL
jgi:hypothetical protein